MLRRFAGLMILAWLTTSLAHGQAMKSFTRDQSVFLVEMNTLFQSIQIKENKEKSLATLKRFSDVWNSGNFFQQQQEMIYQTADLMLQRKLRAFPDFEQYLSALIAFREKNISTENLDTWLKATHEMIERSRNTKSFIEVVTFTKGFLESGVLNSSKIFSWVTGGSPFRFGSDSTFFVRIDRFHLSCYTRNDTAEIQNTSGFYFPETQIWRGDGGKVTWKRANFPENEVYALLREYAIDMKTSAYEASPVTFHYEKYFGGALEGKLTERASTDAVKPENALYPRFESSIRNLIIPGIYQDVDYEGSFMLRGARVIGSGSDNQPATLTFKRPYRDKAGKYDLLVARSDEFIISPERVTAQRAAVTFTHQDDSIVHTGLQLRFTPASREVMLLRTNQGIEQSPYFDSFHKVEFDSEALYWKMEDEVIRLGVMPGLKTESKATFVSDKYFSESHFDNLHGLDRKHPLLWLHDYSKAFNTREFGIDQMADFMRMPQNQTESLVIRLASQGFVHYDILQRKAYITDKVDHYIFAKSKLIDYDVIGVESNVNDRINAELKLENFDLNIKGVPQVSLSAAKKVSIRPVGQEITLRKNRDFVFSGLVQAGLFDFKATDCSFNYDTFKINLPTIDTMRFKVESFESDQFGKKRLVDVKTPITGISGQMLIDHPGNKSGLVPQPRYPIFTSNKESYVYYDHTEKFREAYNRELFNYFVKPFTLESLEEFETESIRFEGHLNSGGIFPAVIDEPLVVMSDYSLGFKRTVPAEGYPVYQGKGRFFDEISLSLSGLKGNGRLIYLNSTSLSPDFSFYLDSATATKTEFTVLPKISGQAEFPSAKGFNLNQHWKPYADSITVSTTDSQIALFDERAALQGSLTLTPGVMSGAGKLDFLNATAQSDLYIFGANSFRADTAKLTLRDLDVSNVVFNTENYRAYVDLNTKIGNFKTNDITSRIDLPVIRYVSFMNEFDWYFDRNEVELFSYAKADESGYDTLTLAEMIGKPLSGARFISLHPMQDSLSFYSDKANYNITENTLRARDVKLIKVADAAIFPGDGLLEIRENAVITPLQNAVIIADTANRNHVITEAEVTIESGYAYKAKGKYAFTNLIGDVQTVNFDQISVDKDYQTVAAGTVTEEDNFELSPRFAFKGDISLNARDPLLNFKGGYRVIQSCDSSLSRWVSFEQRIDAEELTMPVPEQLLEHGYKKLYAGFFHSNEENRVYLAFLSRRSYYSDSLLFSVNGIMKNRKNGAELLIVSADQAGLTEEEEPAAPFLKWDINRCTITSRGKLTFGQDLGQVKMDHYGQADHNIFNDSTFFDLMLMINFHFSEAAFLIMAEDLNGVEKAPVNIESRLLKEGLTAAAGAQAVEKMYSELTLSGQSRNIPAALLKSFIFTDVKMTYHSDSRSFVSKGPIRVVMVNGNPVFKYFDGYIQVVRRRSGDELNIYLELGRGHWYFFNYKTNQMLASSSRSDFNSAMKDVKTTDRRDDQAKGESSYRFNISPDTQAKNRFLRNMQQLEPEEE